MIRFGINKMKDLSEKARKEVEEYFLTLFRNSLKKRSVKELLIEEFREKFKGCTIIIKVPE